MPLVRMGHAAFDLSEVIAVVPKKTKSATVRVTVFLRCAMSVDLDGDEARAFFALLEALPSAPAENLGPDGGRIGGSIRPRRGEATSRK